MKAEQSIYKEAFKQFVFLVVVLALNRVSGSVVIALMGALGCAAALMGRTGFALSMFIFFPATVIMNPYLLPKTQIFSYAARFSPLMIGLLLALRSSSRRGRCQLPFGWLIAYLVVALISSVNGYFPMISYFKIVNFLVFLIGIWVGTRNLHHCPNELFKLRAFMLAMTALFIFGSLALLPFPAISTLNGMAIMGEQFYDAEMTEYLIKESERAMLFCGITYQSQALSGVVSCCFAWVVCDMLFVERRIRWQHLSLIVTAPVLMFMTRSRMGLLVVVVFTLVMLFYTMRHVQLPRQVRQRVFGAVRIGFSLLVIAGVALEISNGSMSKWIRKVDDVKADTRSMTEAVTESRMGLVEENMDDFRYNPLLGCGFQVCKKHLRMFSKSSNGLILSAPIEKGILPLMVLGETGVVGACVFLCFLISFCLVCVRKQFFATLTLFWVLFAANMAEATFFSPGGPGGVEWILTIVGGFIIDMNLYVQRMRTMIFQGMK